MVIKFEYKYYIYIYIISIICIRNVSYYIRNILPLYRVTRYSHCSATAPLRHCATAPEMQSLLPTNIGTTARNIAMCPDNLR